MIDIKAPREQVLNVLWNDKTFRDWVNIIDEGMYMTVDLEKVQSQLKSLCGLTQPVVLS